MLGQFDIDEKANQIGAGDLLFCRDELSFAEGPLDLYEGSLVVQGDGGPGCVVRGTGQVLVKGALIGNARMPARIDVDGDVVILGDVAHAHIEAQAVYVGKRIADAQINARLGLEVGGDVRNVRVRLGEYDLCRKKIERLKKSLEEAEYEKDSLVRKLKMEEKRVDKLFKNTRIILTPNVGRILQARRNQLVVNLKPIYASLPGRNEQEIDKALREFFAKAIVGLLTRENKHFLMSKNRHRQEIFKGVVRDVHDLFFLTRNIDKQIAKCADWSAQVEKAKQAVDGRVAALFVRGRCQHDMTVAVTVPDVMVAEDGKILISGDSARLEVLKAEADHILIKRMNTMGIFSEETVDAAVLKHFQMALIGEEIIWKDIAELASAGM